MIHYHGTPISGRDDEAVRVLAGRAAFVSFAAPKQIEIVAASARSFALDNGAFSAWVGGSPVADWEPFYAWAREWLVHPACDWAIIPDVIDGDEAANDEQLAAWPDDLDGWGVPVWHLHESLDRLERLSRDYRRVALGSSGAFAQPKAPGWWRRMHEAWEALTDDGRPRTKVHGLRMLDPEIVRAFPFASCDSTNVGRNCGVDQAWRGTHQPPDRAWRAILLAARIESAQPPATYTPHAQAVFALETQR